MKRNFFILSVLFFAVSAPLYSQTYCSQAAAAPPPVTADSSVGKTETYVYKNYLNEKGENKQLKIALVRPVDKLPAARKRPLVVGVHGGGFVNFCPLEPCYLKYSENVLARHFAPHGFVTASVQYRLSLPLKLNSLRATDETVREAHYKSVQDVRRALKFIFENADEFGVDAENVFLIGTSAGAITVLHAAYLDNDEAAKESIEKFGPLEKREKIKGVISLSGAIYDLSYLGGGGSSSGGSAEQRIPLMLVHGLEDFVVPADKGLYFGIERLTPVYGGRAIFDAARRKGIPAKGYFYDFGHSIPERFKSEIYKNANDFIRANLSCRENDAVRKAK